MEHYKSLKVLLRTSLFAEEGRYIKPVLRCGEKWICLSWLSFRSFQKVLTFILIVSGRRTSQVVFARRCGSRTLLSSTNFRACFQHIAGTLVFKSCIYFIWSRGRLLNRGTVIFNTIGSSCKSKSFLGIALLLLMLLGSGIVVVGVCDVSESRSLTDSSSSLATDNTSDIILLNEKIWWLCTESYSLRNAILRIH